MTTKFKIGDRVRPSDNEREQCGSLQKDSYEVLGLAASADFLLPGIMLRDDHDDLRRRPEAHYELVAEPTAPSYQPLDDAGRAALKAGDEVLVRLKVTEGRPDQDGEIQGQGLGVMSMYFNPLDVFALLAKAPEPIAVGDKLHSIAPLVHDVTYTCVGHTSDGKVVAEYDAGDGTGVMARDASCWEKVS